MCIDIHINDWITLTSIFSERNNYIGRSKRFDGMRMGYKSFCTFAPSSLDAIYQLIILCGVSIERMYFSPHTHIT